MVSSAELFNASTAFPLPRFHLFTSCDPEKAASRRSSRTLARRRPSKLSEIIFANAPYLAKLFKHRHLGVRIRHHGIIQFQQLLLCGRQLLFVDEELCLLLLPGRLQVSVFALYLVRFFEDYVSPGGTSYGVILNL